MISTSTVMPITSDSLTVKLRSSKLRNRRLLKQHGIQKLDSNYYVRDETDIA